MNFTLDFYDHISQTTVHVFSLQSAWAVKFWLYLIKTELTEQHRIAMSGMEKKFENINKKKRKALKDILFYTFLNINITFWVCNFSWYLSCMYIKKGEDWKNWNVQLAMGHKMSTVKQVGTCLSIHTTENIVDCRVVAKWKKKSERKSIFWQTV